MNRIIFSIIPFLLFGTMAIAQSNDYVIIDKCQLLCYYRYQYCKDSTSSSITVSDMVLQVGSSSSRFSSTTSVIEDSLNHYVVPYVDFATFLNNTLGPLLTSSNSTIFSDFVIYKNYPKKGDLVFFYTQGRNNKYKVYDPEVIDWRIDDKSDTLIMGYRCTKAHTRFRGRNYTAWFTPEIPLNDGPYKFRGLPGLIMLVYDSQNQHRFEIQSIVKPSRNAEILYPSEKNEKRFKQVAPLDFVKAFYNSQMEFYGRVQRDEVPFIFTKQDKIDMLKRIKGENNFIEKN